MAEAAGKIVAARRERSYREWLEYGAELAIDMLDAAESDLEDDELGDEAAL